MRGESRRRGLPRRPETVTEHGVLIHARFVFTRTARAAVRPAEPANVDSTLRLPSSSGCFSSAVWILLTS